MKNIFKGLGISLLTTAVVLGAGAVSAFAATTYAVNAITETGALTITAAGALGLVTGTNALNLGADAAAHTVTIGNITGATAVNINTGTGGSAITTTNGTLALATGTGAINIGTDAVAKTITIGNTTGATAVAINAGSGKIIFTGVINATSPVFVTPVLGAATGTSLSVTGTITPTSAATGAAALTNFLKQTYVIDFGAFSAGVNQTQAEAMTGVAFGDACSVGTSADQSATIGELGVQVTSAGNIKIVASPISAVDTSNPASATYTVTCLR